MTSKKIWLKFVVYLFLLCVMRNVLLTDDCVSLNILQIIFTFQFSITHVLSFVWKLWPIWSERLIIILYYKQNKVYLREKTFYDIQILLFFCCFFSIVSENFFFHGLVSCVQLKVFNDKSRGEAFMINQRMLLQSILCNSYRYIFFWGGGEKGDVV